MPQGQFLGSKSKYVYTSDTSETYIITRDTDLVPANCGLTPYDPANPGGATPPPKGFSFRGVHWQSTAAPVGRRKFIICGTTAAVLYDNDASQALTIDGVAGRTTGRKGERVSF